MATQISEISQEQGMEKTPDASARSTGNETPDTEQGSKTGVEITSSPNSETDRPACFKSTTQEVTCVWIATMSTALSSFLQGSTMVITASIGDTLNMTSAEITWITASTSLAAGSFLLCFGALADLLGRKVLLISGFGCFSCLVLITAFATNAFYMDIFCGLLGLASAAVIPPAAGTLGAAYNSPSRRKNIAFAAFSAGNPLGFVFGSIASGIATKIFDWRASFILLCIIFGIIAIVAYWAVPSMPPEKPAGPRPTLRTLDWPGVAMTVTAFACIISAMSLAPDAPNGWKTSYVVTLLPLGFVILIGFIVREHYYRFPLVPLHIWKDKNFALICVVISFGFMSFSSTQFWLSLYMQNVQQTSSLLIAARLMPQAIAGIIWNVMAGSLMHRVNNTVIMGIGAVAYVVGPLLLYFMKEDSSYWAFMFPSLIITVIGADFEFTIGNMYVMQSLPSHQQSIGSGIFQTVIRLSSSIGLGVSTSVWTTEYNNLSPSAPAIEPYSKAFLCSVCMAAFAACFVPFMTLKTQGNKVETRVENAEEDGEVGEKRQEDNEQP